MVAALAKGSPAGWLPAEGAGVVCTACAAFAEVRRADETGGFRPDPRYMELSSSEESSYLSVSFGSGGWGGRGSLFSALMFCACGWMVLLSVAGRTITRWVDREIHRSAREVGMNHAVSIWYALGGLSGRLIMSFHSA